MEPARKRHLLYKHGGELLRELAVLVLVFGTLDSLIQKEIRSPGAWVVGSVLIAGMAFALRHWCGVESEEPQE
jgi:hypothetical protein